MIIENFAYNEKKVENGRITCVTVLWIKNSSCYLKTLITIDNLDILINFSKTKFSGLVNKIENIQVWNIIFTSGAPD
ncbi:unnamed protein product [marine sediment metagenome]|uniref:Uncharacterized protein n=1 Tax=marine sediment metagenome TaxID=412755 RepID=X1I481_9ZZZZ